MANDCKKCSKRITTSKKAVNCSECGDSYHPICGQISAEMVKEIERGVTDWRCIKCRGTNNRRSFIKTGMDRSDSISSLNNCTTERDTGNIDSTFIELSAEIRNLSIAQAACLKSLEIVNKKMEDLQLLSKNVKIHDKRLNTLEKDNKEMKSLIKNLTLQVDNGEQRANINKLVLSGVPFLPDENLIDITKCAMAKLNVPIDDNDVRDIYRMFKPKQSSINTNIPNSELAGSSQQNNNPPETVTKAKGSTISLNPIIITFSSIKKRNEILKSFRINRDIYINNSVKIYIQEFLIPNRQRLLRKAKIFGRTNGFKYVWTRDGNIFIRKSDGEKPISINNFTDFASLCVVDSEGRDSE